MLRSDRFEAERITTIRFQMAASVDHVTVGLLEAVRRTGLSLLAVTGDDTSVYPHGAVNAMQAASSWRAELLWPADASDQGWHLEVFLCRAEVFLDCPDGVHVAAGAPRRKTSPKKARNRGTYGLDAGFGDLRVFVLDEPV